MLTFERESWPVIQVAKHHWVNLRYSDEVDQMRYALRMTVESLVLADKIVESRIVRVPLTWWDHFKQRWFPRMKIDYREIVVSGPSRICPHLPIEPHQHHLEFLRCANPD